MAELLDHFVSSPFPPEQSKLLVNGVTISLVRANPEDAIHCESVGRELRKSLPMTQKSMAWNMTERILQKFSRPIGKIEFKPIFLLLIGNVVNLSKDSPTPLYAGGGIQFPTVITEWNGHSFEHFHAIYNEDTWVDRHISDEVRALTKGREFPKGVGLGTFSTQGRIVLSALGSAEHNARGRISETATDNAVQLAIFSKLGVSIDLPNGVVVQFDNAPLIEPSRTVAVRVNDFAFQNANNASVSVLPYVFLTAWSNSDGIQQIAATHTKGISTVSGNAIIRSQFTSNGNLPPPNELRNIMTEMVSIGRAVALEREWANDNNGNAQTLPIMRVHAYGREMVDALKAVGGKPRHFGFNERNEPHFMAPAVINYTQIPNTELRSKLHASKPLMVIARQPSG